MTPGALNSQFNLEFRVGPEEVNPLALLLSLVYFSNEFPNL